MAAITFEDETTWGGADGTQALSITVASGESVLAVYGNDGGISAEPALTFDSAAPDEIQFEQSAFTNHSITIAIWYEPGTGSLEFDSPAIFSEAGVQLFTVTNLEAAAMDGLVSGSFGDPAITDTGTFNVATQVSDIPISAVISDTDPSPDQTSVQAALGINSSAVYIELSSGTGIAGNVDMGWTSMSGQSAIVGGNLLDAGGGGSSGNPWYNNLQQQLAGGAT